MQSDAQIKRGCKKRMRKLVIDNGGSQIAGVRLVEPDQAAMTVVDSV
jgi:hypothetical protein